MTFSNFSSVIRMRNAVRGNAGVGHQHLDWTLVLLDSLKARSTASLSVTSHCTPYKPSGAPDPRCVTATLWPSAANRRATASPIPRLPPVTSTDRETNAGCDGICLPRGVGRGFGRFLGGFFSGCVSHPDNLSPQRGNAEIARPCSVRG